jgi:hypothetical protein
MKILYDWRFLSTSFAVLLLSIVNVFPTLAIRPKPLRLTQASGSCRRVIASNGAAIHRSPAMDSPILGIVRPQRSLTIQNPGGSGWVPILAPLQGYVLANHLGLCQQASAPPPNSCRRVVTSQGLGVRQSPSITGKEISYIPSGRRVMIANSGFNGWVPITVPVQGYVSAKGLGYCRWIR